MANQLGGISLFFKSINKMLEPEICSKCFYKIYFAIVQHFIRKTASNFHKRKWQATHRINREIYCKPYSFKIIFTVYCEMFCCYRFYYDQN